MVGYKGGHVEKDVLTQLHIPSLNPKSIGVSQILYIKPPFSYCYPVAVFVPTTACVIVQSPNVPPFGMGAKVEIKICNSNVIKLI